MPPQPFAHTDAVRIRDVIPADQLSHAGAIAPGDGAQRITRTHRMIAPASLLKQLVHPLLHGSGIMTGLRKTLCPRLSIAPFAL